MMGRKKLKNIIVCIPKVALVACILRVMMIIANQMQHLYQNPIPKSRYRTLETTSTTEKMFPTTERDNPKNTNESLPDFTDRPEQRSFYNLTGLFGYPESFLKSKSNNQTTYNFNILPWIHINKSEIDVEHDSWHVVIVIASTNVNTIRRQAIRETWISSNAHKLLRMVAVFLVGTSDAEEVQKSLINENKKHGDILQVDKKDMHRHVTHKTLAAIQWSSTNFPPHWIFAACDDDVYLDIIKYRTEVDVMVKIRRQQLESLFPNDKVSQKQVLKELPIYCGLELIDETAKPYRNRSDKFYISESEYPLKFFPPYCSGPFYTMPIKTASELLAQSIQLPYIWLQDVVVPGILRLMMQTKKGVLLSKYENRSRKFSFGIRGPVLASPVEHISHSMVERIIRRRWRSVDKRYSKMLW